MKLRLLVSAVVVGAALLVGSGRVRAQTVNPGWDLLTTESGTQFDFGPPIGLVPFTGVPLNTFNFGGAIGTKPVGLTDTIVHRLNAANVGDSFTSNLQMVALQLATATPVNLGFGATTYYATLNATPSTGTMTFNTFPVGVWKIRFNLNSDSVLK